MFRMRSSPRPSRRTRTLPRALPPSSTPTEPSLEKWTFSWYEDLFAQDAKNGSVVDVASKVFRRVAIYEPGTYTVKLSYFSGKTTTATWAVRPIAKVKKAKNVIFFIGEQSHLLGD